MNTVLTPDICVIGGGSAGLSVAAGAAAFGVSVVLIERGRMGGDCLNTGCVPSKALIAAAKHAHAIRTAARFGVNAGEPNVDFTRVHARVHEVIATIAPFDSIERFTGLGVQVISAEARFSDARTVVAGDAAIRARRFVIATGSHPFIPEIDGLDDVPYLTNESLFDLTALPDHLVIFGGGAIGMEMAQAHRRLGAAVTVIARGRAFAREDAELAEVALARIAAEGVTLRENADATSVRKTPSGIRVDCKSPHGPFSIEGSHILVATGRHAGLGPLKLESAGIAYTQKGVTVGPRMRSTNKRVYAIGDAAGGLQFTHVAGYHAGLVLQEILFRIPARENRDILPRATYTDPEIASVGLSEDEAHARKIPVTILRWPYGENDRAQTDGQTEGLIKIVAGKRGRILGVGIAGAGAGEMIGMWSMAVANRLSLKHVRTTIYPYPTMSEIGKRAVMAYYAPVARKPVVRRLLGLLRHFG